MRDIVEAMKVLAIDNEAQISFGGHGACLKLVETQNCIPSPTKKNKRVTGNYEEMLFHNLLFIFYIIPLNM